MHTVAEPLLQVGVEIDRATSESAAKSERLGKAWARKKHLSEPGIVVGAILNFIVPLDLLNHILLLRRIVVGTVAFVVGLAMVIGANRIFRNLGTNVRPSQPTPARQSISVRSVAVQTDG